MPRSKIGARHQVTIPKEIFEKLDLEEGDYVEVKNKGGRIELIPQAMIPREQQWFWSEEWQDKEKETEKDIQQGNIDGPYSSAEEAIEALKEKDN
ncbi:MAG: AbrB/MazE/SpoVT family DNA-binding domain-containing protein [bacterium]